MSARLPEHLELIAAAPNGIQKLRGLILELAVRGKLVPQDANDEPASELLKRIAKEKARLVAEGTCKKLKARPLVGEDERPFAVPDNWKCVRLPEVYFSISPSSNKLLSSAIQETGAVPVVDQGKREIAGYTDQVSMLIKIPGPVVIFGDHTTERKYVDFDFVAGADGVKILRPILQYEKFFFRQLQAFKLEERGYARHFKVLNDQLYAMPPLAEQHRIVAKVDELMALCDRLDAEQTDAANVHTTLVDTLLGTLTKSRDAEELAANWQRLSEHFDTLFSTEASLDALKQTILQFAVMGKLVPQDLNDEPASELLKQVQLEKANIFPANKVQRYKSLTVMSDDRRLFEVPVGWEWTKLQQLAVNGPSNGYSPKPSVYETSFRCLTLSATTQGYFKPDCFKYVDISEPVAQQFYLKKGDLLIQRGNSLNYVGMAAIYDQEDDLFIYPDLMMRIQIAALFDARFLHAWLVSSCGRAYFMRSATGTQGTMPKVNQGTVSATPIPVPPLHEQRRIVAKVDELMALCDRLKSDLAESRARQARLATTLIESALKAA